MSEAVRVGDLRVSTLPSLRSVPSVPTMTSVQIKSMMIDEVIRVTADRLSEPTEDQLIEAFRLGVDIGYNRTEIRKLVYSFVSSTERKS